MLALPTVRLLGRPMLQKLTKLALTTAALQVHSLLPRSAEQSLLRTNHLSFSTAAQAPAITVAENEYEIVTKDTGNLWSQLRDIIKDQRWTTQDHATLKLLEKLPNVINIFIVRKSDGYLLGGVVLIETADLTYGNIYIMREGYRAAGMGMKLVAKFQGVLAKAFAEKPLLARGVPAMMGKYAGPPFYASHLYKLFSYEFESKKDLKDFFPAPASHPYKIVSIKDLTPKQFQEVVEYDKKVTGVDRTVFLKEYYSFDFTNAAIAYDKDNKIRGMAGIVPTTTEDGLFKVNPIYAESQEDACTLVHAVADQNNHPNAHFVLHSRTESAGDWILEKCKDTGRKLHLVGVLCNATNLNQIYKDPSKTEWMHAPTNSPAHFDG